jgi:hypothetical protein
MSKKNLNKQAVYKFHADCGRMGDLEGIFVQRKDYVQALIDSGVEVYFGEVLGKHSEVCGSIDAKELIMLSEDENIVDIFVKNKIYSGFNPFDYANLQGRDIIDIVECIVNGGEDCENEEE